MADGSAWTSPTLSEAGGEPLRWRTTPEETLQEPDDLMGRLREALLLTPGSAGPATAAVLGSARHLRETVDRAVLAVADGRLPTSGDVTLLTARQRRPPDPPCNSSSPTTDWNPPTPRPSPPTPHSRWHSSPRTPSTCCCPPRSGAYASAERTTARCVSWTALRPATAAGAPCPAAETARRSASIRRVHDRAAGSRKADAGDSAAPSGARTRGWAGDALDVLRLHRVASLAANPGRRRARRTRGVAPVPPTHVDHSHCLAVIILLTPGKRLDSDSEQRPYIATEGTLWHATPRSTSR